MLARVRQLLGRCGKCGADDPGGRLCAPCLLETVEDYDEVEEDGESTGDKPAYFE